jgi:DNA-binding response OmpR family regulator
MDREGGMTPASDVRILIVEDDVYFQRILQKRLESEGFRVSCANDGREGMKVIVTWDPHLVISDWMMPHVDGLELCQSVKTGLKEAAPYFILLTAKGEINDRLLGLETGADDYLVKPCDQGEITARVRAGLRNILLARELQRALAELENARGELDATRAEMRRITAELPLCVTCKRVRSGEGHWRDLHVYLVEHQLSEFAFCTCPECEAQAAKRASDRRAA